MKIEEISQFISRQKIGLRIGAAGLALVLWVFVVSNDFYFMTLTTPIEVRNLSVRKALREEVPKEALVRFYGTGRALFKAFLLKRFYDEFKLVLDLERISDEYEFFLNSYFKEYPQKVVIPPSFDIEYIEIVYPFQVSISLDEYLVKTVPIVSGINLMTAPGYVLVGIIELTPDSAVVAGPMEVIQDLSQLLTNSDTLDQVNLPVSVQIGLKSPGNLVQFTPEQVHYHADVQAISERIITEVPVDIVNVPSGYRIFVSPTTVALTIIGGANRISRIEPEEINVTIDFGSQWNSEIQFYEPTVSVPEGVIDWQDLSPRNLELIVTRESN